MNSGSTGRKSTLSSQFTRASVCIKLLQLKGLLHGAEAEQPLKLQVSERSRISRSERCFSLSGEDVQVVDLSNSDLFVQFDTLLARSGQKSVKLEIVSTQGEDSRALCSGQI